MTWSEARELRKLKTGVMKGWLVRGEGGSFIFYLSAMLGARGLPALIWGPCTEAQNCREQLHINSGPPDRYLRRQTRT